MKKRKTQKQKQSFKLIMEKSIAFGISFGLIFGLMVVTGIYFINKNKQTVKEDLTNSFQSLYYQSTDLKIPEDVSRIKLVASDSVNMVSKKIPIVMYHYVEYVADKNDTMRMKLDINPYLFEKQIRSLVHNRYNTYFVRDIPEILNDDIYYSSESAVLTFDDGYADFYTVVYPLLKKYQVKATIYVINDFIGRWGFLNEEQIKEMLGSGLIELGAHTLDHLYLKTVSDEVAIKQIVESKKKLEEKFGVEVKTFAYPYGAFNQKTIEIVRDAGFVAAVSVIPGTMQTDKNLFYLNRVRSGAFPLNY